MTNGYQSDLLLSDKLILVAMVTLNDGSGKILRRRLLSFSSSEAVKSMSLLHSSTEGVPGGRRSLLQQAAGAADLAEYISVPLKAPQVRDLASFHA